MTRTFYREFAALPPPLILALLYALLILLGAALLLLPVAHTVPVTWSDALFTSTSAVTVTGLVVLDTGQDLTVFGQAVLAFLIQMGGLGLMTFAVLILGALGLPVGITGHQYLREDLNQTSMHQLRALVSTILKVVLLCEGIGALLLLMVFAPDLGPAKGLWTAVFHSISAFNNAGFSTFADGLVSYATDPVVNVVIPALFIVGGIGYVVLHDVFSKQSWRKFSLHSKLMLIGTAILIQWSVGMFALLEWSNPETLGQLDSAGARLVVSWFQGVTTRTAGFNTTDIGALHESTSMMFISLMLIGGGPTSTAGGIKVTTFIVMMIATVAFFRRQQQLHAFGRSIALDQVLKVMALTAISVILVFVGVFLIVASHEGHFLDVSFEVASAFGTVGLSRGFTGELSDFGRAVIMAIMFIGRVGPLTLGFFLATRTAPRLRYPEGQVYLG
ncbi:TrkH family potassium uptake protein [Mameliella sediminis]|uniref:TrkH family potassium uptake protein n=1 Tax=Mameliella sediminis TaxID=2836866 RepID=UPI001C494F6E|nr:TrkH family potassium uptake protein [Mameliella sediminis]MBV7396869.1 TrkH family potassium uptake protein [Mameliella sediminis]MBY6116173.1 TrkH family potassium uptake protein [Antarctobacter heliothermus]MBY6146138.1 TrkH family potassium uptake protein [Mameliella alba]MCA0955323.1 TrkH family potassium uptake protein [Mameliella alba]